MSCILGQIKNIFRQVWFQNVSFACCLLLVFLAFSVFVLSLECKYIFYLYTTILSLVQSNTVNKECPKEIRTKQ